jgi:tRNA A-37 threonylcarbamoyl transferase component Bud32
MNPPDDTAGKVRRFLARELETEARTQEEGLAELVVREKFLTREQLQNCLRSRPGLPLYDALRSEGLLTDAQVESLLDLQRRQAAGRSVRRRLGRYELLELLGEGATGLVFRARDEALGREVALKMLKTVQSMSPILVERFKREGRNVARLKHPGIVAIYDTGNEEDALYYTMELVPGRPFDPCAGELSPRVRILAQVARAVEYAHEQGLVHRDLKPANILVDPQGLPRLLDFGLSRDLDAAGDLSRTGTVLGTPHYMAPEQAAGRIREVDGRTDVYALGVILYEILAGRVPFDGPDMASLLHHVIDGKAAQPPGPEGLRAIALKAMRKAPAARYATAGAFAMDLERYLEGKPVGALTALPRRRWARWVAGLTAAAVLLAGAALLVRKPAGAGSGDDFSRSEFEELRKKLQPPENEPWRTIPWKLSLLEAQNQAARERKPIFLWSMMGHPLGAAGGGALADRGSLFNDPEAVTILNHYFIPVAVDEPIVRNRKDAEGEFFRKVAAQVYGPTFNRTMEGKYACSPDGKLLAHTNHYFPERLKQLLRAALERFAPSEFSEIPRGPADPSYDWKAPNQGLVAGVTAKVLGGYLPTEDPWTHILQESLARNRLWLWKDETDALGRGELPDAVRRRLARFCFVDLTRGAEPPWGMDEIRLLELSLDAGRLTGRVHLESKSGERGYIARVLGVLEVREGKVTRFDLVARGSYWCRSDASPPGKYPFAVSVTLAPRDTWIDVPPFGVRELPDYMR